MFACVVMNCDGARVRAASLSLFPQRVLPSRTRADARALTETSNLRPQITSCLRSLYPIVGLIDCDSHLHPHRHADYLFSRNINIPHSTARRHAKLLQLRKLKSLPENPPASIAAICGAPLARNWIVCVFRASLALTQSERLKHGVIPSESESHVHVCGFFVIDVDLLLGQWFAPVM